MKQLSFNTKNVWLLSSRLFLMSSGILADRWFSLTDFQHGLLKGAAIGLIILAVLSSRK